VRFGAVPLTAGAGAIEPAGNRGERAMTQLIGRRAALGGGLVLAASAGAVAQPRQPDWPTRPIRIFHSGSAGGTSDILMRVIGEHAIAVLGQQFVLDPRPGGGGMISMGALKAAPTDGYNYMVNHTQTHAFGPTLYAGRLPYDPLRDFAAVARLVRMPNLLYVRADHPANTVAELIAWFRANPDRQMFSHSGPGASTHMGEVLFANLTGLPMTFVTYRGSAPSAQAVINGEVPASIENMIAVAGFVQSGQLKPLAVTTAERAPQLPNLPTVAETVPGYEISTWFGLIAAGGVAPPILQRFGAVLRDSLAVPRVRDRLLELGAVPAWLDGAAYESFMAAEIERWAPVVRASGVRVE